MVKDECVWTLGKLEVDILVFALLVSLYIQEDRNLIRISLVKTHREASNCWKSLLEGQFEGNAWEVDQMEKKLTLERFQNEASGF